MEFYQHVSIEVPFLTPLPALYQMEGLFVFTVEGLRPPINTRSRLCLHLSRILWEATMGALEKRSTLFGHGHWTPVAAMVCYRRGGSSWKLLWVPSKNLREEEDLF